MNGSELRRDIPALIALIEARSAMPFGWRRGRDCASFAAAAIEAQTGIDPIAELSWRSRREALAIVAEDGGLVGAMDKRLRRIAPAMAMRGDIAGVADEHTGVRLMVIEGTMLVAPGSRGLDRVPRSHMTVAWDSMSVAGDG